MSASSSPVSPATSSQSAADSGRRFRTISRFSGNATCKSLTASTLGVAVWAEGTDVSLAYARAPGEWPPAAGRL
jgi:hypothetical protein